MSRWPRIVAEWANPGDPSGSQQLVVNRHLLLWELGRLDPGEGWVDDEGAAGWIAHRHGSVAVAEAALECLRDLRILGVVAGDGPAG